MKRNVRWVVARLGADMNWWVDETSEEVYWGRDSLSLLDPRQVAYLRETMEEYKSYGFNPKSFAKAFHLFEVASEMSDGRIKLIPSQHDFTEEGVPLYALPDLLAESEGHYPGFLDQVATMRIKRLNDTHDYFQDVTELDMDEDIQARNADRYFSARAVHVFNELEDILSWKPAEWDDSEEDDERMRETEPGEREEEDE